MNPILRLLGAIGHYGATSSGDIQYDIPIPENLKDAQENKGLDRIKAAFDAIKTMHKNPSLALLEGPMSAQVQSQPQQTPQQRIDGAFAQLPSQAVPMPKPRPAMLDAMAQAAPEETSQAEMPWWMRNAALQKDPETGEFLDPAMAAKAQPNAFKGLF